MQNNLDLKRYIDERVVRIPFSGCWLWTGCVDNNGYPLTGKVHAPERKIHRLAWHCYRGLIPSGIHVLHKCDVPLCVNPDHLFLGTQVDNMKDRKRKGRNALFSGERHGMAKLTNAQADEIRRSSISAKDAAKLYGVTQWAVFAIRSGRTRSGL
jgi:hypothetical protein